MPKIALRGFPQTTVHIQASQQNVTVEETINLGNGPMITLPVANDHSASVTVSEQIVIDAVNIPGNTGEGRVVSAVGAVAGSSDGETASHDGRYITFNAGSTAEAVTLTYTLSTGDGGTTTGGTDTGTITITKEAVQQPGSGTLNLYVADTVSLNGKTQTAPQLIAPAGYLFYAEGSGFGVEDHYTDVRYKWDFDDATATTQNHPRDSLPWDRVYDVDGTEYIVRGTKVFNRATGAEHATPAVKESLKGYRPNHGTVRTFLGHDLNLSYGPRAVHVFNEPGVYTVTCEAQRRGEAAVTETITITVLDPDTEFDDTYVVATDGNFTGAPSGTQVTSVDAAMAAINTSADGTKRRMLLKSGQTFSASMISPNINLDAFHIGAWGTGDKPILRTGISFGSNETYSSVKGIHIRPGSFTADDPFSNPSGTCIDKKVDGWLTLSDLKMDRTYRPIVFTRKQKRGLIGQDLYSTDWQKYGMFSNSGCGEYGVKGFFFVQNKDAIMFEGEDETESPWYVDHGPQRAAGLGGPVVFSLCDMRAIGSRTASSAANWHQPCFRLGRSRSGYGLKIEEVVVDRARGELGRMIGTGNSGSSGDARKYLYDKIYCASVDATEHQFGIGVTGLHIRNVVHVIPNTPSAASNKSKAWLKRTPADKDNYSDLNSISEYGVDLYNSTLVDLRDYSVIYWELDLLENGGTVGTKTYLPAKHVKIGNNVVHVPNRSADSPDTETGDGPYDTTEIWRSDYPGARYETYLPLASQYAIPDGSLCYYELDIGSPAIGDASLSDSTPGNGQGSRIAVDDFWGNIRGTTTSRGAFD